MSQTRFQQGASDTCRAQACGALDVAVEASGVAVVCLDTLFLLQEGETVGFAECERLGLSDQIAALVLSGREIWGDHAIFETVPARAHVERLMSAVPRLSYPVIAAVSGNVSNIGAALAFACDFVVAEETICMRLASRAYHGVTAPKGQAANRWRAVEQLMPGSAACLDARDAFAAGLVDWVVAANQGRRTAIDLAKTLAMGPGELMTLVRRQVDLRRTALAA